MKRLAVIGCGLRGDSYMAKLRPDLGREFQLVALADPSPVARKVYLEHYGDPSVKTFSSGPELLAAMGAGLDAAIVASPNHFHRESAVPAMARGLTLLLEKPVATTVADLATIWKAYRSSGEPPVAIGFVLRYTPFYRKVKELIDGGAVGQVLAIEASELLGNTISALFMREWRRFEAQAGPFILEKCCHDLDLLNWFAGAPPVRVTSIASRTRFVPNPLAALHCKDCRFIDTCRYSTRRIVPYTIDAMDTSRAYLKPLLPWGNDLCVFNSEKDIPDHQAVALEYANGVIANFTACMDQPRTTRTIRVYGTEAELSGDIGKDELVLTRHPQKTLVDWTSEKIAIQHDGSGHHGGDSVITNQFKAMMHGDRTPPAAGLREGVAAGVVALAAEQARHEKREVDVAALYHSVFASS